MAPEFHPGVIGLMTDHNPGMLVGALAALKAGCGFTPIDPSYPAERIGFIFADCGIEILITEAKYLPQSLQLAELHPSLKHIICLDRVEEKLAALNGVELYDGDDIAAKSPANQEAGVAAGQPVYVIYTSGSTGQPKGVTISHENIVPLLAWSQAYFNLGEDTRVLQNLSFCFDFGVFEQLTTVLFGGTLYYPDRDRLTHLSQYSDFINCESINTIHSTPSVFREVLSPGGDLISLKTLHLGGEALTADAVKEIVDRVSSECVIYNGYGPTETAVSCCVFPVGSSTTFKELAANIPIGKVSANNLLYILDSAGQPAPIGVDGELHIGGIGVAAGYLNRPDLTAEKFVPDPFDNAPGARLYKSGDLTRYREDGNIEFLGRRDQQLKLHGFRIEPEEIASVLRQHPGVADAIVTLRDDASGDRRLLAYVIPQPPNDSHVQDWRAYLQEKLPYYMIPHLFVRINELPLTANGKLNYHLLPVPDWAAAPAMLDYVAPRTALEEVVAILWAELLGHERVGIHDNFFELGGHSLMAMRLISRLRDEFQLELPLRAIFEKPTIAELADALPKDAHERHRLERIAEILLSLERLSDDQIESALGTASAYAGGVAVDE